ncbi:FAD:protein FMN transferase [Cognaticolwellia beringensis]|uniref:FAD:protein FMN transferase n=1 Tax=Cognaticolwellia beringensis TaxID=1967665 RepID=A0A222G5J8_9GAMM|nr:FAD:protein FMN transferase [Cognaticolwellia beringensis]ASP47188.1 FAD:protein FMN transferase [Cognaticolwellia beringensis]
MQSERNVELTVTDDGHCIHFQAMASPCEVLIANSDGKLALTLGELVAKEVWRIEDKYSRYKPTSVCSVINESRGKAIAIDQETYLLLNFADTCYQLSEGVFDITSGVLRQVWQFDGSDNIPSVDAVKKVIANMGWHKVSFDEQQIVMPENMEIDFGGIGKEYAVDRAMIIANEFTDLPVLVNLGGDLAANKPRKDNVPWQVGIEHPGFIERKPMVVSLLQGALATSGDAKRFLLKDHVRYSHILNAKTGWPIEMAPRSITVVAPQCIQAGILATLALMQGEQAESFLTEQEIKFWAIR